MRRLLWLFILASLVPCSGLGCGASEPSPTVQTAPPTANDLGRLPKRQPRSH